MKYISESLKTNTTFEMIDLTSNGIKNKGIKFLSDALKMNTTLKGGSISDNSIDDKEIKHFCDSLKINSTPELNIKENEYYNQGRELLVDLLFQNSSLKNVSSILMIKKMKKKFSVLYFLFTLKQKKIKIPKIYID